MKLGLPARLVAGAAAAALAAAVSVAAAGAAGASTPNASQAVLSVSIGPSHPVPQGTGTAPAALPCRPALGAFNRTQLCYQEPVRVVILLNRNPVGLALFNVTHAMQLNPRGRDFSESVTIGGVRLIGNAGGIHVALGVACDPSCVATKNNFPVGATLRSGLHGDLGYHDSVGRGGVHRDTSRYAWLFVKAGFTPGAVNARLPIAFRCDFAISSSPGCIFPGFTPVMTSMQRLPHIAANIRRIQSRGGHYGRFGSGHPLHHITDAAQQRRNHDFLCPPSRPRPPGMQCDEYPFASTREGGSGVPPNSRGWAWVPAGEQRSQGGLINSFYNANRVLNGDAFWVQV